MGNLLCLYVTNTWISEAFLTINIDDFLSQLTVLFSKSIHNASKHTSSITSGEEITIIGLLIILFCSGCYTKYHRLASIYLLIFMETGSLRSEFLHGWVLVRPSSWLAEECLLDVAHPTIS